MLQLHIEVSRIDNLLHMLADHFFTRTRDDANRLKELGVLALH